jgi:hypothetical protein
MGGNSKTTYAASRIPGRFNKILGKLKIAANGDF